MAEYPEENTISVVIPVYRSEKTLDPLYEEVVRVADGNEYDYEIIFVEDCGGDDSWEVIERLVRKDKRVTGIKLARNYGQHNALLCGIRQAKGKYVVTIDDDLQNPPSEIPKLIDKINEGYDVVYGSPKKEQHGIFRDFASKVTKITLGKSMGANTAEKVSAFRVFRTNLREAFSGYRSPTVNIDVLLTWGTAKFTSIKVEHGQRMEGESGYSFHKLVTHAFNMMTGFSVLPLQMASILGFIFSGMGLVSLLYVLGRYIVDGSSVPGFPFLASLISIFSGVQLFTLGIFGEYLARMHFRSMEKPPYAVACIATDRPSDNSV